MARRPSQYLTLILSVLLVGGCAPQIQAPQEISVTRIGEPDHLKAALVNVELGLGYLSQGQVARAKHKLTHAVQLAPLLPEPHSAMAYFLERVGEPTEAEKEYKKAIRLGHGAGAVYNNYGTFLCRQGRLTEADTAFQRALQDKQYPCTAEVYENAGLAAIQGSEVERAEQYFLKAIQQDPKCSTAVLELANLKLQQHRFEEVKKLLTQYQAFSEPTARSLWLTIQTSHALKDKQAVSRHIELLKNLFQDSPEYQQFLNSDLGKL